MIDGVDFISLKVIPDSRGAIFHAMRRDNLMFQGFDLQEVYFSLIYPGVVKGWHLHRRMTLNYVVPVGNIKLVLFDNREGSVTGGNLDEHYLGEKRYGMIRIPPGVWNGFMAVGNQPALVANLTDCIHDPAEMLRMSPRAFSEFFLEYDWFASLQG